MKIFFYKWVSWSGISELGTNINLSRYPKPITNPFSTTLKGMCTHRPLFKCQGQLKFKFTFPFANVSKEINAILRLGITPFISEVKRSSLPMTVTELHICHLILVIDLVGKLCSTLISFSLFLIWD